MLTPTALHAPAGAVCALLAAAGIALTAVSPALAHPALIPASLSVGTTTRIQAQIPNEREGRETIGLRLTFPVGFTVGEVESTGDWRGSGGGRSASWQGGRITGESAVAFALELTTEAATGTYDVVLEQRYDDGRAVTTRAGITVLPAVGEAAPDQHVGRAIAAAVAGLVVVVGTLVGLRSLRRRQAKG